MHSVHFFKPFCISFILFFRYKILNFFFVSRHHFTVLLCQTEDLLFLFLDKIYIFFLSFSRFIEQFLQIILKHTRLMLLFIFLFASE